jgi:hypothetical protein
MGIARLAFEFGAEYAKLQLQCPYKYGAVMVYVVTG